MTNVVNWYTKLTHSEEGRALLDYNNFESKTLVVAKEYIRKVDSKEDLKVDTKEDLKVDTKEDLKVDTKSSCIYAKFRSFREFAHYFKSVSYNNKCFHEVIPGFLPQKPYFDIDVEDISQYDNVNEAIKCLLFIIKEMLPQIGDRDILIFNSNGETKLSYHIVIDRWCFLDYRNNKAFVEKVLNLLSENKKNIGIESHHISRIESSQITEIGTQ